MIFITYSPIYWNFLLIALFYLCTYFNMSCVCLCYLFVWHRHVLCICVLMEISGGDVLFSITLYPLFLRQDLSLNLVLGSWPSSIKEFSVSIPLTLHRSTDIYILLFMEVLGFEPRSSCFHSKCTYPFSHISSPSWLFYSDFLISYSFLQCL